MKVEAISRLRPLQVALPQDRPAPANPPFEGERGKSADALRRAADRGVGAEHKQAHSRRFGALLDEQA
jgi:hypothetical protein